MAQASSITDPLLIAQIKQGNEKAFRQLFDRYYPPMIVSANYILKDKNVAQDAAQDVFVLLWKNRTKLSDTINIKAYLNRAVINKALTILKVRKRHTGENELTLLQKEDTSNYVDGLLENKELKNIIHKAIDALPEKRRIIFTLCRLQGLSHKEIAEKLNISTKTIENQMTQALKQLRVAIKKSYDGPLLVLLLFWMDFL